MNNSKEKIELIRKAIDLKLSGKYKDALVTLYKAFEYNHNPEDDIEILSQIAQLHENLGNYERALEEFQKALSINPHHTLSLQKSYEIYTKLKQYQKANYTAQKMFEADKNPISCYCYLESLINLDKKEDAIEIFNGLEDDDIKLDCDVLFLISKTYDDPIKRELLLKKIIDIDETNQKANLELVKMKIEQNEWDEAVQYCANLEMDDYLAQYYTGLIEAKRQNYQRAVELFISAIKLGNNEYDFYLDLAKAYIDQAAFTEALGALKESIKYSLMKNDKTRLDEKYFLSGWVLIKRNEFSQAMLNLSSINESSKLYQNAQILLQLINLKKYNLAKAKTILEKYVKRDEKNLFILDSLAFVYKELKLYKNAIYMFNKALRIYPDSIYYRLELIDLLIDDKRYDEAFFLIHEFNSKNDKCASIYNSMTRIYYRQKDYQNALSSITRCIELDSNNPESYYFKGLILNDMQEYEKAKSPIYNAIKNSPDTAKYYAQMAKSYKGTGQYDDALLYIKEAIELNPDEINYKRLAFEIANSIGDEIKINIYKKLLERSEKILKSR